MSYKPWGDLAGVRPTKLMHRLIDKGLDYEQALKVMQERHSISQEKYDLLWHVATRERPLMEECCHPSFFSIYVGIPFCPTRCLYCSFPSYSLKELGVLRGRYVEALILEIKAAGKLAALKGLRPQSVYIGGGTPTSLLPEELDTVLAALRAAFPGVWRELTVEAGRPETLTTPHLDVLKKWQACRISINPQTMHEETLKAIGRCHSPEDVAQAVSLARKYGIRTINMDLIIGLPGENKAMAVETVKGVLAFAPENITLHVFSRKRASRFNTERGRYQLPSADEAAEMHEAVCEQLETLYRPYYLYRQREILGGLENIGYTLPGHECLYNILMIEEREHILGLGCGANSKLIRNDLSLVNINNPKDVRLYIDRVAEGLIEKEKFFFEL